MCWFLVSGAGNLAKARPVDNISALSNPFFKNPNSLENEDVFLDKQKRVALETPDLKIIQDYFAYGISTPRVLTTQTLGAIFGEAEGRNERKEVINYVVQPGDTIQGLAQDFNISSDTILWANDLSKDSVLKVGQTIVVLPVSGVIHVVRSGDTISEIGKTYKAKTDEITSFNNLTNEGDIFIGDVLIIPGGTMPVKSAPAPAQIRLADNFFIYPAEGYISQGLHYYNAIDVANKCGTPIYAAATGVAQRVVANGGWNFGMGNYITVLHADGVSTYYGHLSSALVSPGQRVNVGDRIGLMGATGRTTGCHVHFQVMGARNPLTGYSVGAKIKYGK